MGVNGLWTLLSPAARHVPSEATASLRLAVDASIWIAQFIHAMRDSDGMILRNAHLLGFFRRCAKLLFHNVRPLFVFDGQTPILKKETVRRRRSLRQRQEKLLRRKAERLLLNNIRLSEMERKRKDAKEKQNLENNQLEKDLEGKNNEQKKEAVMSGQQQEQIQAVTKHVSFHPQVEECEFDEDFNDNNDHELGFLVEEHRDDDEDQTENDPAFNEADIDAFENPDDIDLGTLAVMPASVQFDLIQKVKKRVRAANREKWERTMHTTGNMNPAAFSQQQIQSFLVSTKFNKKIADARKQLGSLAGPAKRIASDPRRQYLFEKNTQPVLLDKNQSSQENKLKKPNFEASWVRQALNKGKAHPRNTPFPTQLVSRFAPDPTIDSNPMAEVEVKDILDAFEEQPVRDSESDLDDIDWEPVTTCGVVSSPKELVGSVNESLESNLPTSPSPQQDPIAQESKNDFLQRALTGLNKGFRIATQQQAHSVPNKHQSMQQSVAVDKLPDSDSDDEKQMELAMKMSLGDNLAGPSSIHPDISKHLPNEKVPLQELSDVERGDDADLALAIQMSLEHNGKPEQHTIEIENSSESHLQPTDAQHTSENYEQTDPSPQPFKDMAEASEMEEGFDEQAMERLRAEIDAENNLLREEVRSKRAAADSISAEMYGEIRDLLKLFGLPYVEATMKAEAQCAFYDMHDLVDGVITEDSDVFLFGARSVYRHFFEGSNLIEFYDMKQVEQQLGFDRDNLIRMALLLGSDYTDGIHGIGIVNATEIIEAFPTESDFQEFAAWCRNMSFLEKEPQWDLLSEEERMKSEFCWKHRNMKRNWEVSENFPDQRVIEAYRDPGVDHSTTAFQWGRIDVEGLVSFCWDKFGWTRARVLELLTPVIKVQESRQGSTDDNP